MNKNERDASDTKRGTWFLYKSASYPWMTTLSSVSIGIIVVWFLWWLESDELFNWWAAIGTWATIAAFVLAVLIWLATSSDTEKLRTEISALGGLVSGLDMRNQSDAEFSQRDVEAAIGALHEPGSDDRISPQAFLKSLKSMTVNRRPPIVTDRSNLPLANDEELKAPIEVAPGAVPDDIVSAFNGDIVRDDIESATFFPGPGRSKNWMIRTRNKRFAVSLLPSGGKVIHKLPR